MRTPSKGHMYLYTPQRPGRPTLPFAHVQAGRQAALKKRPCCKAEGKRLRPHCPTATQPTAGRQAGSGCTGPTASPVTRSCERDVHLAVDLVGPYVGGEAAQAGLRERSLEGAAGARPEGVAPQEQLLHARMHARTAGRVGQEQEGGGMGGAGSKEPSRHRRRSGGARGLLGK